MNPLVQNVENVAFCKQAKRTRWVHKSFDLFCLLTRGHFNVSSFDNTSAVLMLLFEKLILQSAIVLMIAISSSIHEATPLNHVSRR